MKQAIVLSFIVLAVPTASRAQTAVEIGDYCTPAQIQTDITQCAQAAIAAAGASANAAYGGGKVHFPADLSPYNLL